MSSTIRPRVLPASFSEEHFDKALDSIAEIVGAENVSRTSAEGNLDGPHGQKCYGDVWAMRAADEHEPSGAIRPASTEEVQAVLRIANKYKLPLWTVSRGRNMGYGGSAPVVRGDVVLDLHRINKVIAVDEEYAYAVVEPGVSFFDLYEHIKKNNLDLWPSCAALGWGSVLGNTLDRGFGYTPNGEHSQQQCGMEVVLPNGEILRTGMGAMENSIMTSLYKGGFGPSVDGLFFQSNFGVVTKIGIHLTPAPAHFMECEVSVLHENELGLLVSTIARLERQNIIQNHASIGNLFRQALSSQDPKILSRLLGPGMQGGCASDADLASFQKEAGLGYWIASFGIYGPSFDFVSACATAVKAAFADVPGAIFRGEPYSGKDGKLLKSADMPQFDIPHTGLPGIRGLSMVDSRGPGGGHTCFSPLFPSGGKELDNWYKEARKIVQKANFDFFSDFHVYGRYTIAIILFVYSPKEGPRADALFKELVENGINNHQSTEYRTHIDYMDSISEHFQFGDRALHRFVTGLKDHLDPNAILSQGKSGIWSAGRSKA